jgi:hypothetical protein
VDTDERLAILLSTSFDTFCTGIDGHKTLASPAVNAALRDILTSSRELFWEVHEAVVEGQKGAFQNVLTFLMIIDSVRRLSKAQGMDRTDLDELIALVPEEWETVESMLESQNARLVAVNRAGELFFGEIA